MTTNQLKMFNQCVDAIDAGHSFMLTGCHPGAKAIVLRALREKYGDLFPAPSPDPVNTRRWMPEIEDETLPPGYRYWSQEAKDRYNKQRAEAIKQFMKPITDKLPKTGFPLIITSCDSDTDHFKDLFTKAE